MRYFQDRWAWFKGKETKGFYNKGACTNIVYNITDKEFEDRGLKIEVLHYSGDDQSAERAAGNWTIDTFSVLVEGVKAVTDTFVPYIRSNLAFIAEAGITEDYSHLVKIQV